MRKPKQALHPQRVPSVEQPEEFATNLGEENVGGFSSNVAFSDVATVRLLGGAVRRNWKMTEEIADNLADDMYRMVQNGTTENAIINAARVLVLMHGQNQAADTQRAPTTQTNVNVQVNAIGTLDEAALSALRAARRIASNATTQERD